VAGELQELRAAGVGARHAHRQVRGLGAGHREARQLAGGDQLVDQLGPPHLERVAGAQVGAARHLLLHGAHGRGVAVAREERAVAHPVVDVLVAVDVPLAAAGRAIDVDRMRGQVTDVVGDPAWNRLARLLGERGRLGMLRAVLVQDAHARSPRLDPWPHDNPSSATSAAWVSASGASTVGSRRRVRPADAPAPTQASMSFRSSAGVCSSVWPVSRPSWATMPYAPQLETPATPRGSPDTTPEMRAMSAPSRASRPRTQPMPISLPPSPTPIVIGRRARRARTNISSRGRFQAATDTPRAFR